MIFDTRVDNPEGLPKSIDDLPDEGPDSPWPEGPPRRPPDVPPSIVTLGHAGSSCPGYFSKMASFGLGNNIEIPVEILAFHVEGDNGICKYSVGMFSEVFGRVSAKIDEPEKAQLYMWGKMLVSMRPHNPEEFGGHELIQLRSKNYVKQTGTITGFPPRTAGEYIESSGNEEYVGFHPGQRHIRAVVERGRVIFSTDVDQFLQARTRISGFTLVDKAGNDLDAGEPPYDPSLIGVIGGVKLAWQDIRGEYPHITHYRVYRLDPDEPQKVVLIDEVMTKTEYTDSQYDGRRSYAYAVVPAFVDGAGTEVQGVSLDHAIIMGIEPRPEQFRRQNMGVGHIRWMK